MRLPHILTALTGAAVMLLLAACGASPAEKVARATEAMRLDDFESAQRYSHEVAGDSASLGTLSVSQLCELANVLVRLPESSDVNDGLAVKCLNKARSISVDSVEAFLSTCSPDEAMRLSTLNQVGAYLEMPRGDLMVEDEEYIDTIH